MKFLICLVATIVATAAHADSLTFETVGNCIGLVKTTDATGTVTYSDAHNLNVKYSECYTSSIEIARTGNKTGATQDLVEVYVRFDNPNAGETYSYNKFTGTSEFGDERVVLAGEVSAEEYHKAISEWIAQIPLGNP